MLLTLPGGKRFTLILSVILLGVALHSVAQEKVMDKSIGYLAQGVLKLHD